MIVFNHNCDSCYNFSDVSTTPSNCTDYEIRLVDGDADNRGRVQMCLNNIWGAFCHIDANMICKEIGYNNGQF